MSILDAENWLLSTQRALESIMLNEINNAVMDDVTPVGLQAFEIVWEWPESDDVARSVELGKTVIHLALDDIDNRKLGLGLDQVAATEILDPGEGPDEIIWHEGQGHFLNYDVGVWASDQSGGVTSRNLIYQMLHKSFGTQVGKDKVRLATQGIEILRFNGGRGITDRVNDVRLFRLIDVELVIRVFSKVSVPPIIIADVIEQDPDLTIDEIPIA